ncbi:efflux RND transporter permease subunit [Marinicella sediminis]|uniref:Efflux RND transporter permease subunit n=1 Tax=Marinicella sediminis TaxID=1792834 RepID=A0ABV7J5R2_9GAMM|nr:efflux RND transporter permease subunit [Marinicella sediminis]
MKQINQGTTGFIAWFTRNPVAANLLMAFILVAGFMTALNIRTEAFPAFPPNSVNIDVTFIGGTPAEVEEGVTIKIEEALEGIEGIKEISSSVSGSGTSVTVTAVEGYELKRLKDDIKLNIDAISSFPDQAEKPVIKEQVFERRVLSLELYGDSDHSSMKKVAERVRDELMKADGINKVDITGAKAYEISIEVSERTLREYNLTLQDIARSIQNNSVNLSGGSITSDQRTINIKTDEQAYYGPEFARLVVGQSATGKPLLLEDVAVINDGFAERRTFSRYNGKPSIQLQVKLLSSDSITRAAADVKAKIAQVKSQNWFPENIQTAIWNDESEVIRDRLSLMMSNALTGIVLVLIMLTLFLHLKVAFWVALGIPIAFAGALFVLGPAVADYSLNVLTTFGFIVVLGIVVDDAIVIGENIYSAKQESGLGDPDPVGTTIKATQNVAIPATFGVLTTVAAFLPLTLISSQFGEILGSIAAVVIFCLLFSLVESKWILPAHLAHIKIAEPDNQHSHWWQRFQNRIDEGLHHFIRQRYRPFLHRAITHKALTLSCFIALFILTVGLVPGGLVRTSFFPDVEQETSVADLEMQSGLGALITDETTRKIEQAALQVNQQAYDLFGTDNPPIQSVYAFNTTDQKSKTYIQLAVDPDRAYSSQEVVNAWRKNMGELPGVKSLEVYALGPGSGVDIRLELSSANDQALATAASELRQKLAEYQGVYDLKTNYDEGTPEFAFTLNQLGQSLGLNQADVARQIRYALFGFEAQRIQRGKDEIRVKVRYPESERDQLTDLNHIRITTANGATIPLYEIAEFSPQLALSEITRYNKKRVVYVSGRVDKIRTSSSEILADLNATYLDNMRQRYPDIDIDFGGQSREQSAATASLIQGFGLSLILIYALLAIPLKSYVQPLIIMSVIPFGIIGAILGHWFLGIPLGLLSFFGILALSGVVVNDSLVLVNRYNEYKAEGLNYYDAIKMAAQSRFRAIILTSLTTFMGLSPLVFEQSFQAQFLVPMAVSLAFGILFATLITLLIVPTMVGIVERLNGSLPADQ